MRIRWRTLFCFSLLALLGNVWLNASFHWSLASWVNAPILGLLAAAGVALAAAITDTRKRWPAAVALVCLAPFGQFLYHVISELPSILRFLGMPGVLILTGSAGALCMAIHILVVAPAPAPIDPLPRARST
jgi:cytochrome bd-type quinol oxidase subunit 2